MQPRVLVVGLTHLDSIARASGGAVEFWLEIGGTAHNCACNLHSLGLRPLLLSALPNDGLSLMVEDAMTQRGLEVRTVRSETARAGGTSVHIDERGRTLSELTLYQPGEFSLPLELLMAGLSEPFNAVVFDTSLTLELAQALLQFACVQSLPVLILASGFDAPQQLESLAASAPTLSRVFAVTDCGRTPDEDSPALQKWFRLHANTETVIAVAPGHRQGQLMLLRRANTNAHVLGQAEALGAGLLHALLSGKTLVEAPLAAIEVAQAVSTRPGRHLLSGDCVSLGVTRLAAAALQDPLTGLLNRRGFEREVSREGLERRAMSVLTFDIDKFKVLNDTYGHDVGDEALKWVGAALISQLRSHDIASRWGGEEFVVLLPQTRVDDAERIANRIREHIAANSSASVTGGFTVSIGVAAHEPSTSIERTLKRADTALYDAKHSGRNKVVVAP